VKTSDDVAAAKQETVQKAMQAVVPQSDKPEAAPWLRYPPKRMLRERLLELVWQGLSWPYLVSIFLTAMASFGRVDWTICLTAWGGALGIRTIQTAVQGTAMSQIIRAGNGSSSPPLRPAGGGYR